jgi:hypothetical protein
MKLLMFAATAWLLASATAFAEVQVSIRDGLVTIVANDATVRQIISEWARVGQAKVVNAERIPGGPTTLELRDVPEAQVLDTLLRSAAGYLAAPRAAIASNLSRFDRVVIMPTSSAPRNTAAAPPAYPQPQFVQPPTADDDADDDRPAPNVAMPAPRGGPVFNTFPQPQVVNPANPQATPVMVPGQMPPSMQVPTEQQQQPVTYPSSPTNPYGGVAVPGMIVPTPQQQIQPGQIVPPGQQPPPRRPGGGPGRPDGDRQ